MQPLERPRRARAIRCCRRPTSCRCKRSSQGTMTTAFPGRTKAGTSRTERTRRFFTGMSAPICWLECRGGETGTTGGRNRAHARHAPVVRVSPDDVAVAPTRRSGRCRVFRRIRLDALGNIKAFAPIEEFLPLGPRVVELLVPDALLHERAVGGNKQAVDARCLGTPRLEVLRKGRQ